LSRGAWTQASVAVSQRSVVQASPSSQETGRPATQRLVASQRSSPLQ
jgi:hypothetical protein